MRTAPQPLVVRSDRDLRRSTSSELAIYSPEQLGGRPSNGNGSTWVPLRPERPVRDRRARLATTSTLTCLTLIAVTLLTPSAGFALVQWFVIIIAVAAIVVYLRRQYSRAASRF